ncbi:MAG: hypothetical protein ACOC7S_01820 [Planctomycetota bacterium]
MNLRSGKNRLKAWLCAVDVFCAMIAALLLLDADALGLGGLPARVAPQSPAQEATLEEDLQRARSRLKKLREELRGLRVQLQALKEQREKLDTEGLQAEIERIRTEIGRKGIQRRRLMQRIRELKRIIEADPGEVEGRLADWEGKVAEARRELRSLRREKAQLQVAVRETRESAKVPPRRVKLNRSAVAIVLVRDRVVPVKEPYFKVIEQGLTQLAGKYVPAERIKRVKSGQPIDQAIRSGGLLTSVLGEMDPEDEYVVFFVCADSIPAYYAARKVAIERGIAYDWEAHEDQPLTRVMSAGENDGYDPGAAN